MKFDLFNELYLEVAESSDLEYYIADRGWQEWMDSYEDDKIAAILTTIYQLASSPLKDTREVSRAEFSRRYNIPIRTLEDWDNNKRTPPEYVKTLLDYTQFMSSTWL